MKQLTIINMEQYSEGRKNQKFESLRGKIKMSLPSFSPIKRRSESVARPITHDLQTKQSQPIDNQFKSQLSEYPPFISLQKFHLKNAFQEKYQILQKLGEGANGVVKKCRFKATSQLFAVKIGRMEEQHVVALKAIVMIMRNIVHDNILKTKELYVDVKRSKYYQVMEYLPHPSLKNLLSHRYKFKSTCIQKIMKQLLSALEYFHKHHIVHRDIKTSNLLFDVQKSKLHVIDLGIITKTVQRDKRRNLWTNTGTLQYKAPEMLEGSSYNEGVDVWAAGVVLYQLVEGKTPFRQQTQIDTIENIRQIKYKFTPQLWIDIPLAKLLVTRLLKPKGQRLTANIALKDPWFQLMDFEYKLPKMNSPLKPLKLINASSIPTSNAGIIQSEAVKKSEIDEDGETVFGLSAQSKQFLRMTSYQSRVKSNIQIKISFDEMERMLGNQVQKDIINNNN